MNERADVERLTDEMRANAAALASARAQVKRLEDEAVDLTRQLIAAYDRQEAADARP